MTTEVPASESAEVTPTQADSVEVTPVVVADDPALVAPDLNAPVAPDAPVVPEAPVALVEPAPVEAVAADSVPAEVVSAELPPVAFAPVPPIVPVAPVPPVAPAQQVVYVQAPRPFAAKGNRGFGVLIALLSTVIYAALYAVALVATEVLDGAPADFSFVTTLGFYAPVAMFAIGFILLVLIVNRAGWAAHVLGSLLVGLIVFFGGTGLYLLIHASEIPSNEIGVTFHRVLFSVAVIIGALLAREVALWMGFVVAARGRKVKARNVEARAVYDQEIAEKRAEYERANAHNAAQATAVPVPVAPVPVAQPTAPQPVAEAPFAEPTAVTEPVQASEAP
jgi:hypothetical protein